MGNCFFNQSIKKANLRISSSSVADVKQRDTKLLAKLAKDFNLTYTAFGESLTSGSSGTLTLTDAWGTALEPAPITPTDATPFKLLSGTIRSTYNAHRGFENEEQITVAPGIMTGNTGKFIFSSSMLRQKVAFFMANIDYLLYV